MSEPTFLIDDYLARIGLSEPPPVTSEGLTQLHNAQAFHIPFENLDVLAGKPIELDEASIFHKLVTEHRGGYCFELNGLFLQALCALGFQAERVLARVLLGRTDPGPKTHQAMIVTIDGDEYLADVGFGGPGLVSPIEMVDQIEQEQFGQTFRLCFSGGTATLKRRQSDGSWMGLYTFDRSPVPQVDVVMSNFYTSTFPQSRFKLDRIVVIPTPTGRITLLNEELTIYDHDQATKEQLADGPDLQHAMMKYFGLPELGELVESEHHSLSSF